MNSIEEILIQQQRRAVYVGSDFVNLDCLTQFTEVETGAATIAVGTGANNVGGQVVFNTTAAANLDCYLASPEVFDFGPGGLAGKSIVGEARIKYTEIATNDAIVVFGFMSAVGGDSMLDEALGPKAVYSGAVIYKVTDSLLWKVEGSTNGGANIYGGTSTAIPGGGTWQTLRVEGHPLTATRMDISFLIDDGGGSNFVPLRDSNLIPLKYEMDITTTVPMSLVVGLKCHNAGSSDETLYLDYMHGIQIRT